MYEEQLAQYNEQGFTVVRALFSPDEITELEKELHRFIEKGAKDLRRDEINYTPDGKINSIHRLAGIDAKNEGNAFWELMNSERMSNLVRIFLNDDPDPRRVELFAKPARTGMKSPWHQDNFYWAIKGGNALTVWLALDHCGPHNGGVSYFAGSHKLGTIDHKNSYAPGSSQTIASQEVLDTYKDKIACPELYPGDCAIHHANTIHGSLDNMSGNSRRGITFQYKGLHSEYDLKMQEHYQTQLNAQVDLREKAKQDTERMV